MEARLEAEAIDVTIPGTPVQLGHRHPMNKALDEAKDIFISMGFKILDGPEVELADYNFTKLNIAENHPSRDRSDTFYVTDDEEVLLRTQTSPMQIRAMEAIGQPPIRILAPGRVYRKDEVDATHSPMFHQIEGLVIDKGITDANNMGAAMAPAAYSTLRAHFEETGRAPDFYDLIVTGDLGSLGKGIVLDFFRQDGVSLGPCYDDCGVLLFDPKRQDVHAGGSGCGCSAVVLTGYLLRALQAGTCHNLLFCGTGALHSPTATMQGESIPGICHAVAIASTKGGKP